MGFTSSFEAEAWAGVAKGCSSSSSSGSVSLPPAFDAASSSNPGSSFRFEVAWKKYLHTIHKYSVLNTPTQEDPIKQAVMDAPEERVLLTSSSRERYTSTPPRHTRLTTSSV